MKIHTITVLSVVAILVAAAFFLPGGFLDGDHADTAGIAQAIPRG